MTDDPIMKASEAPLMDHLVELRTRLLKSLFSLAITFAFCFYFADFIFAYLLSPYEAAALAVSPAPDRAHSRWMRALVSAPIRPMAVGLGACLPARLVATSRSLR